MSKCRLTIVSLFLLLNLLAVPGAALGISWKKIDSAKFRIYCQEFKEGKEVLGIVKEIYPDITSDLSYDAPGKIKVYVFHDHSSFVKRSPSKEAGGYTYPFKNEIFISTAKGSLDTTLRHELTHIVFIRSVPDISKVPFWFIEGLAYYQSRPDLSTFEGEAVATRKDLPTIKQLSRERLSGEEQENEVAMEGYLAVKYIAEVYGEAKLYDLVRRLQQGEDFSGSIQKSLGVTEKKLEARWRKYVREQRQELSLIQLRHVGLLILGFLSILAAIFGFWRYRRRFKALEEEEMSTDYEEKEEDIY